MSSSYPRNNLMETDAMFLEFDDDLDNTGGESSSVGNNTRTSSQQPATPTPRTCAVSTLGVRAPCCNKWMHSNDDRLWSGEAYFPTRRSLQPGDRRQLFVLDFNDQAMNKFVEHQMLMTFKEFWADYYRHFKKYSDSERLVPTYQMHWSNHRRTGLLDRSSLTIIVTGLSRFYNDSTSSLREKMSRSIVWSCFRKHTFELRRSCRRPQRMCMCWVDDQATQKALVRDPSQRPAGRRVRAVRRHLVRSPHKKRLNYKLNLMKLWNGLKCKIEITKR
ncbi:NBS-LRR type resistance protein [Cucumis melo var. makuwa]|uniref:NBS-LRR type resistance protein n=1 Tax=Cucumis melo var. makuwa TaxID=1194695 RepID=A0A5D3BN89_CUCMM|nr:NBS-LRR type resistance protein [Cucumis melo var. makuwa]TYK00192.1 NBS-LRR type resistance protein [Cucumis melo var. makuwa]